MLWSYAVHLTYKGDVPVWLLQPVVFCIINWKFCFCFRHFNLNSPWALETGLTRQIFSRAVLISFHCILLVQLLLFLISCYFCSLKFFSLTFLVSIIWYLKKNPKTPQQSNLPHAPLYSLTFNICVQSSDFQSCSEGNSSRGGEVQGQPGEQRLEFPSSSPSLQVTARKWFCALLTLRAWLQDLFLEVFRDLHGLFFFFSLHSVFVHH